MSSEHSDAFDFFATSSMGASGVRGPVGAPVELVELPLLLTVAQAAEVLNIKRTLAYRLTQLYLTSCGRDGIPVITLGGCRRVPRRALLILAETGYVVNLSELAALERELLQRQSGLRVTITRPARRVQGASARPRSSGGRVPARVRRSPGSRPAVVVEQLRLLPPG